MANVKIVWDGARMEELKRGPNGPIARYLETRATIVQKSAIIDCPKRPDHQPPGNLWKTILKRPVEFNTGELSVIVGAYAPYAAYVHEGTSPHVILPKKPGGTLHFMINGEDVFTKRVNHPGTKANPFLSKQLVLAVR